MKISKKLISLGLAISFIVVNVPNVQALSTVERIEGKDKYEIAAKIAEKQNYSTAIIVNADNSVADGLSASGLSGTVDAPILLTSKDKLPLSTSNKLNGVKKVYIIGGTEAISQAVENEINNKKIEVKRIGGNDRIETSYNVAKEIASIKKVDTVMLTNAYKGEADAMSIAPVAVRDDSPIILTNGNTIPFNLENIDSYVIGGNIIMSDKLVQDTNSTRLGGEDRFDTNKKIVSEFYPNVQQFHITKGWTLVDALITAPIAKNSPTVLVDNTSDKTILEGATNLTFVGDIDESIIQQCIDASNKNQFVDEYTMSLFNQELELISTYLEGVSSMMDRGWGYVVSYARKVDSTLIDFYNLHLSINSNSALYNEMTYVIYNTCMYNRALANNDIQGSFLWLNELSDSLDRVYEILPRSAVNKIEIPQMDKSKNKNDRNIDMNIINEEVEKLLLINIK